MIWKCRGVNNNAEEVLVDEGDFGVPFDVTEVPKQLETADGHKQHEVNVCLYNSDEAYGQNHVDKFKASMVKVWPEKHGQPLGFDPKGRMMYIGKQLEEQLWIAMLPKECLERGEGGRVQELEGKMRANTVPGATDIGDNQRVYRSAGQELPAYQPSVIFAGDTPEDGFEISMYNEAGYQVPWQMPRAFQTCSVMVDLERVHGLFQGWDEEGGEFGNMKSPQVIMKFKKRVELLNEGLCAVMMEEEDMGHLPHH
ncbi:hypothetical protein EDD16DRAFT_1524316 [Pisolithus croceorrhizus]|nr:hypothetical protein F5141DRAFT_1066785 [Pisolithus sp. B1]KAI6105289.1 hypothetical protein EDD16DRAFT_1524316 [Pisolithus croceorrhizus]